MKPVDQTRFGFPEGNCFAACVASLLNLPIEDGPSFTMPPDDGSWWPVFQDYLRPRGFYALCFELQNGWRPAGLHILSGKSPRGDFLHSVVARGEEIVHDPHPSRAGVLTHRDVIMLVPLDPAPGGRA